MSESKLAATRAALREALRETDDRGTRFYIREALQHLVILETRRDRDEPEDEPTPALGVGPRGDAATSGEFDSVEAAEFLAHERDRN